MIALLGFFRIVPGWCYALVAVVALAGAGALYERKAGEASVQSKWDAATAKQAADDKAALDIRTESNRMEKRAQADRSTNIQKAHDDEIAKVRSDIASQRLRVSAAFCPATGSPDTKSASGGNGTDTGGRVVSESVQGSINDLEMKVEKAFAAGRAAQEFIRENGMAPEK